THFIFLLSMLLSSPLSTLFPYTTLFRSSYEGLLEHFHCERGTSAMGANFRHEEDLVAVASQRPAQPVFGLPVEILPAVVEKIDRSEEHTSELQSLAYLVCRLLLEKKKKY